MARLGMFCLPWIGHLNPCSTLAHELIGRGHDQHGVSARIEWTGTGLRITASECEPARLRDAVETVLGEASFRESARRFQRIIAEGDGLNRAADIIERVAAKGRPVLRGESFAGPPDQTAAAEERQRKAP